MDETFENNLCGMGVIDSEGAFADVNPMLCQLLGIRRSSLLKRPAQAIVSDDDAARFARLLRAKKPSRKPLRIDIRTKAGQATPCLAAIISVQASSSTGEHRVLQIQRLESKKNGVAKPVAEKELKYKEEPRLNDLISRYPGIIYRCAFGPRRILQFVTAGCKRLTAYSPAELKRFESFDTALIHPADLANVQQRLRLAFVREAAYNLIYRLIRKDGVEVWVRDQGQGIFVDGELIACEGFITDITETYRMGLRFTHQMTHDQLTGLSNRQQFEQRIERALAQAKVHGHIHTLCYIDLDQFKLINDSVGHQAGDELLKHVAVLLRCKVRESDVIARLGGDEFGILFTYCPLEKCRPLTEELVRELAAMRFPWQDRLFEVGASIGLVEINPHSENASSVMSRADIACYTAKDLGRGRVHVYEEEDVELIKRHAGILHVSGLREALDDDQFRLYCQPIKPTVERADQHKHYEVLLRLSDSQGQLILPGAFIPAAEKYGLMRFIDRWVIRNVLESYERYFEGDFKVQLAVNLSGTSLSDVQLLDYISELLQQSSINPEQLCFEITETAAVQNLQSAIEFIKQGRDLGCSFALDDFGSGLSSFAYLKYFPVNYLKIDGGFVRDMDSDHNDRVLVAAINEIGHLMGMQTIAEWVETDEVLDSLRAMQVDYAQGSAIGKPIPFDRSTVVGL